MSGIPKSSERIKAEIALRDYAYNRQRLAETEAEAIHSTAPRPEVPINGKNRTSDDTARRAIALSSVERRRLAEDVAAIDYAYSLCSIRPSGDKVRKIIDMVYKNGTHSMQRAAVEVGLCSQEWAGRLASRFFAWVSDWYTF